MSAGPKVVWQDGHLVVGPVSFSTGDVTLSGLPDLLAAALGVHPLITTTFPDDPDATEPATSVVDREMSIYRAGFRAGTRERRREFVVLFIVGWLVPLAGIVGLAVTR